MVSNAAPATRREPKGVRPLWVTPAFGHSGNLRRTSDRRARGLVNAKASAFREDTAARTRYTRVERVRSTHGDRRGVCPARCGLGVRLGPRSERRRPGFPGARSAHLSPTNGQAVQEAARRGRIALDRAFVTYAPACGGPHSRLDHGL